MAATAAAASGPGAAIAGGCGCAVGLGVNYGTGQLYDEVARTVEREAFNARREWNNFVSRNINPLRNRIQQKLRNTSISRALENARYRARR